MWTKKILGTLLCLIYISLTHLSGCAHKPNGQSSTQSPLVGKWRRVPDVGNILQFGADGTAVSTTQLSKKIVAKRSTYKIVDDTHIVFTTRKQSTDTKTTDVPVEYNISGTLLTLKYPNQGTLSFQKVN